MAFRQGKNFFVSIVYLFWTIALTLILAADYQIFNPVELFRLKKDKTFWEWNSIHGRLQVHYHEKGKGNHHLIFLHGFRSHTYTWRHLMEPLAEAGYHVWAIDLIGYGLSDKPDHVPYTHAFFTEQIRAFMEEHQIANAHLVGNSMGGGLSLNMAVTNPSLVKSLTLISALGYPLDLPFYLTIGRHFNQIWVHFLGPTVIRLCLNAIVYNQNNVTDEQVEAYTLPYRFPGGALASLLTLRQFDNQILVDLSEKYNQVKQPLLLIWGDHDTLIPLTHFEKFCKDFPLAHQLVIVDCGHIPQEEEPLQVADALIKFLDHLPD